MDRNIVIGIVAAGIALICIIIISTLKIHDIKTGPFHSLIKQLRKIDIKSENAPSIKPADLPVKIPIFIYSFILLKRKGFKRINTDLYLDTFFNQLTLMPKNCEPRREFSHCQTAKHIGDELMFVDIMQQVVTNKSFLGNNYIKIDEAVEFELKELLIVRELISNESNDFVLKFANTLSDQALNEKKTKLFIKK